MACFPHLYSVYFQLVSEAAPLRAPSIIGIGSLFSCTAPTMAGPRIQLAFEINDLTEYSILTVFLAGLIFGVR